MHLNDCGFSISLKASTVSFASIFMDLVQRSGVCICQPFEPHLNSNSDLLNSQTETIYFRIYSANNKNILTNAFEFSLIIINCYFFFFVFFSIAVTLNAAPKQATATLMISILTTIFVVAISQQLMIFS